MCIRDRVFAFTSVFAQKKDDDRSMTPEMRAANAEALFAEGEKFYVLEDYEKALHYFKRSAELEAGKAGIHYKLAETLWKSEAPEDRKVALNEIEQAVRLDPSNKFYFLLAAEMFSQDGQFSKACVLLETMLSTIPDTEGSLEALAGYYQLDNKPQEALKTLDREEKYYGVNERTSLHKISILSETGRADQAEAEGRKLMAAFPEEPQYVMALAEVLTGRGKSSEAIQLLEVLISGNHDDGFGRLMLAGILFSDGQRARAMEIAGQVMDNPDIPTENKIMLFKSMSTAVNNNGIPDVLLGETLIRLLTRMKAGSPGEADVYLSGGDFFLSLNRPSEARMHYRKAIRMGSMEFQAWSNLLVLDSRQDMMDSLIIHSEEAMEFFPNQAQVWFFNGYGNFYKRQFRKAIGSLETARKLNDDKAMSVSINELLGDAYHQTGEHEKSDKSYDAVLAIDPDNTRVLNNYCFYLSLRKTRLEEAGKMTERLLKLDPSNNSYLDTHAWVLFARGKYKEARKWIEKVIASGAANPVHIEHYGDILFQLGETDEAVRQWELALSMNSRNDLLRKKILNRRLN